MKKITFCFLVLFCVLGLSMALATNADVKPTPTPIPTPVPTAAPVVNDSFDIMPTLGYDGLLLMNRWMPTFVTVTNHGEDFDGLIAVNAYLNETQYDRFELPLTLAGGATKRVVLPIRPQVQQDMYAFELIRDGKIIAEERTRPARVAPPETLTVGLLAEDAKALSYMNVPGGSADSLRGERWITLPLTLGTFPETDALIDCFSMLVVDGVDARALTDTQQEVLVSWLSRGGIVYLSGGAKAATDYPFFERFSGLKAGKLIESEDITKAMLSFTAIKGTPTLETAWLSAIPEAKALFETEAGDGLVAMSRVQSGLLFTAAFDLSASSLSSWSRMTSFWPRLLRLAAPLEYNDLLTRLDSFAYSNESYRTSGVIDELPIENKEGSIVILIILLVYIGFIGIGGYLILKKLDLREWLWAIIPALAVAFTGIFLIMSAASTINKPVALTAARVLMTDGGEPEISVHMGVATQKRGTVSVGAGDLMPSVVSEEYYSFDSGNSGRRTYRPLELRQQYRFGEEPSISFSQNGPWQRRLLYAQKVPGAAALGTLDANVWVEADGIHGEITNGTELRLTNCLILSPFGYCMVDSLLPGQRADIEMLMPKTPISPDAPSGKIQAGIMYGTLSMDALSLTSYQRNYDIQTFLSSALSNDNDAINRIPNPDLKRSLISLYDGTFPFYDTNPAFYFFGFTDSVGRVDLTLDGDPITRQSHTAVVGKRMQFNPVGPTGSVLYPEGLIPLEILIDQEDELPRVPTADEIDPSMMTNRGNYLDVNKTVAARFVLPAYGTYSIQKMTLASHAYDSPPTLFLYNHEKGAWEAQKMLTLSMDDKRWAPYIDAQGGLYLRFVPSGENRYAGMSMPTLSLKGEVIKSADD